MAISGSSEVIAANLSPGPWETPRTIYWSVFLVLPDMTCTPTNRYQGGIWDGEAEDCSKVGIGSLYPLDVDDEGRLEYNWCNIPVSFSDICSGHQLTLGGNNRCGQVIDSDVIGQPLAEIFDTTADPGMTNPVGQCLFSDDWKEDCASDGSLLYNDLVTCSITADCP